jgi:predicted amino acid dehydrogenase
MELVDTMVPTPSRRKTNGIITGGDPATVLVRVGDDGIHILEPGLVWEGPSTPVERATPFAKAPLHATAARVAELIILASSKRLSRYRWCPRCRRVQEPEHMLKSVCHGCAEKVLGVVF